jgi:hypothetical protein
VQELLAKEIMAEILIMGQLAHKQMVAVAVVGQALVEMLQELDLEALVVLQAYHQFPVHW